MLTRPQFLPSELEIPNGSQLNTGFISGYNGVFICGANPYWMFLTKRGELRSHPMIIDGEVINFAPFNNVNCPEGFLYFNRMVRLL